MGISTGGGGGGASGDANLIAAWNRTDVTQFGAAETFTGASGGIAGTGVLNYDTVTFADPTINFNVSGNARGGIVFPFAASLTVSRFRVIISARSRGGVAWLDGTDFFAVFVMGSGAGASMYGYEFGLWSGLQQMLAIEAGVARGQINAPQSPVATNGQSPPGMKYIVDCNLVGNDFPNGMQACEGWAPASHGGARVETKLADWGGFIGSITAGNWVAQGPYTRVGFGMDTQNLNKNGDVYIDDFRIERHPYDRTS